MKILVIADIHGYDKELDAILSVPTKNIDVVLFVGDLIDIYRIPDGFSQIDMADMVLQKLLSLNKPLLCIPGNHDPYESIGLFENYGVNIHNKTTKVGKTTFLGFGGAKTPFNTTIEPSEEETNIMLSKHTPPPQYIFVVHQPPKNTKQDRITTGQHVGSDAVRQYIIKTKPLVVVTGHIHEGQGIDHIGNTIIFNPGPAFEKRYGIIEVSGKEIVCESKQTI